MSICYVKHSPLRYIVRPHLVAFKPISILLFTSSLNPSTLQSCARRAAFGSFARHAANTGQQGDFRYRVVVDLCHAVLALCGGKKRIDSVALAPWATVENQRLVQVHRGYGDSYWFCHVMLARRMETATVIQRRRLAEASCTSNGRAR